MGTHSRRWVWRFGSWRSVCPCWKPHRWVSAHPPPERPCGSCWTLLSSHHCLPADIEHIWQFRQGNGQPWSLALSFLLKRDWEKQRKKQLTIFCLGEYGWQISRCNNWCGARSVISIFIWHSLLCTLLQIKQSITLHLPDSSHVYAAHLVIKAVIVVIIVKSHSQIDKQRHRTGTSVFINLTLFQMH